MLNIWIINHYGDPPTTGKYTRHYNFAKNLIKKGHNVKIFTASTIHSTNINHIEDKVLYKEEIISGVPFIFVRACNYEGNGRLRIKNMLEYAYRILKVAKNYEKPDVIYASSPHPLTWLSGYRLAKRYKAKYIVETRDLWPETFIAMGKIKRNGIIAKIMYSLEKHIYTKADRIIFTIPLGKEYIKDMNWEYKVDLEKVNYINNGVDISEFTSNKSMYIYEDTDLECNNTFKVIYTGAMGQANALNYLIEAAKIIQDMGINNIKFILFGDGYQSEGLKQYAMQNNLENVIFSGRVDKKYIPHIVSNSNLNIFTGKDIDLYKYGLSLNKMFEYFASGKPTLSNVKCGYDILQKYNCGITVKGGSAETLAEGILKFYNMPKEEYNEYCKNALKAAQDFDFKILTDKLEKIILELYSN